MFRLSGFNIATIALAAGALIVVYTRTRKWYDSSVPLIYYAIMVAYVNTLEGRLAPWVVYAGLTLALLLRFEFMNKPLTTLVQILEYGVLAIIVYACGSMVLGR